jgi:hypothetical protein
MRARRAGTLLSMPRFPKARRRPRAADSTASLADANAGEACSRGILLISIQAAIDYTRD